MGKQPILKPTTGLWHRPAQGSGFARAALWAAVVLSMTLGLQFPVWSARPAQTIADWRGEYYAGTDLIGAPVLVRDDRDPGGTPGLDFDWGSGAPAPGLPTDGFSARWTKRETFEAGTYRFWATVDDGIRLFVDGELVIDAWQRQADGRQALEAERTLDAGPHTLRVEYFESAGLAVARVGWEAAPAAVRGLALGAADDGAWRVEYFANPELRGEPALARIHTGTDGTPGLNLDWGLRAPAKGLPADGFSVRWTRRVTLGQGVYRFRASVDDGMRVWVDGALAIDEWRNGTQREVVAEQALAAGAHSLRVEYYDHEGLAAARLHWERVTPAAGSDLAWKGEYWANPDLSGSPALVRSDPALAFEWGPGAPGKGLPDDGFAARWTRTVDLEGGTYRFYTRVDGGIRLRLNDRLLLDGWSNLETARDQTDATLGKGSYTIRVEYLDRNADARIHVAWEQIAALSYADWKGEYWSNRYLSGEPAVVRNDPGPGDDDLGLAFNWGTGTPSPDLPVDGFSARWTRTVDLKGGVYRFYALSDDGVRVWVDGQRLIDEWTDQGPTQFTGQAVLSPGEHALQVEYYEQTGSAQARLWWERIDDR